MRQWVTLNQPMCVSAMVSVMPLSGRMRSLEGSKGQTTVALGDALAG